MFYFTKLYSRSTTDMYISCFSFIQFCLWLGIKTCIYRCVVLCMILMCLIFWVSTCMCCLCLHSFFIHNERHIVYYIAYTFIWTWAIKFNICLILVATVLEHKHCKLQKYTQSSLQSDDVRMVLINMLNTRTNYMIYVPNGRDDMGISKDLCE